jgi:DNA-binding NarL/FixJ family response regulator
MIRVLLADDQALVRLGLRTLIEVEPDLELAGEAEDGHAALAMIRERSPDVVLLDVRMPGLDGLATLRRLAADPEASDVRVIILTTFELDDYIFEALRAGASGFLTKDAEPEELLRAIRVVAEGNSLLSPAVTRRVIQRFGADPSAGRAHRPHPELHLLTDREREIVSWVATGSSNETIAKQLVVSAATVRTHVSRAMVKLGARDRAQLVVIAYQSGIPIPYV